MSSATLWKPISLVMLFGVTLLCMLALQTARARCENRVNSRDDARDVWVYLVARDPDRRDDPDVVEFVEFLNGRLPILECSWWGTPTTVKETQ
jgi:hypothetical protein